VYLLETSDGMKGTVVDPYGIYSDGSVTRFMAEVQDISKKMTRHNKNVC
jgi:hypothetical protein